MGGAKCSEPSNIFCKTVQYFFDDVISIHLHVKIQIQYPWFLRRSRWTCKNNVASKTLYLNNNYIILDGHEVNTWKYWTRYANILDESKTSPILFVYRVQYVLYWPNDEIQYSHYYSNIKDSNFEPFLFQKLHASSSNDVMWKVARFDFFFLIIFGG